MKLYFKTIRYLAPRGYQLTLTIVVSVLASLFSVVSISIILPLLDTVFNTQSKPISDSSPSNTFAPTFINTDEIKNNFLQFFQNTMQGQTREDTLLHICLFLIGIFVLKNFFIYLSNQLVYRVETKSTKKLRDDVFNKIIGMELGFFHNHRVGTLMNYVNNEVRFISETIGASFIIILRNAMMAFFYFLVLLIISWKLTLFALFTSLGSLLLIRIIGKLVREQADFMQQKMGDINSHLQEVFSGIKVVKSNVMENYETGRFSQFTDLFRRASVKISSLRGMISPLNETLGVSAIALVLWYGGLQVFQGSMQSIELIVFAFALFSAMGPIKIVAETVSRAQEGFPAAEKVFEILETKQSIENGTIQIKDLKHEILFKEVWFRYPSSPEGEYILKGVNLRIHKGETVALVGQSGSGKSTIVDLLLRFYDIEKGKILIDGIDIQEYDYHSLRALFGVVNQEVVLFNESIAGNIAYGLLEHTTQERVVEAAKLANAHDFILDETPNAYETNIGDRGTRLSGGQRQRLSIARAMLKNPPILIFDEATSALDNASEQKVQDAIDNAMRDRTSIVIAHRLSTIKNANRIYVLEKGVLLESGTHQELLTKAGAYHALYMMQFAQREKQELH
ncbi:MAG: ABC transporter ATP-binding protein [Chloroherpetonaceae bacterium]|nr:ABC transporter ATP-binding protein [Chloroherpetonaceae bacterium]